MTILKTKDAMDRAIQESAFALFYLSRPQCGVCGVLKKKIEEISLKYEKLETFYFDLNDDETVAGQYSIFTIPGILVFVDGKEYIREARYISVDDIDSRLRRIAQML